MDVQDFRLRAAIRATWYLALGLLLLTYLQYVVYLLALNAQPLWLLNLWGPGARWDTIRGPWMGAILAMKFCVLVAACVASWLSLWRRQANRLARSAGVGSVPAHLRTGESHAY